jgi:hypothetical protein
MVYHAPNSGTDVAKVRDVLYSRRQDVLKTDHALLIGKLPGGTLRYLHKLFIPRSNVIIQVEDILGFPIPTSYAEFLLFSDGATLFDNTLFIYGTSEAETREISVQNMRPLGLREQNKETRNSSWSEVGSLAGATKNYSIRLNRHGSISLVSPDGGSQNYSSFLTMLFVVIQIINNNCGPRGLIDDTAGALQSEIDSYIYKQQ